MTVKLVQTALARWLPTDFRQPKLSARDPTAAHPRATYHSCWNKPLLTLDDKANNQPVAPGAKRTAPP